MPKKIHGVLPILHTPFLASGDIDRDCLAREVEWAFDVGADGVGTGMVSEILRLSYSERIQLTDWIVAAADDRGSVFAAVGAESIRMACEFSQAAESSGCDAVMAVPPVTMRLSSESLLDYFRSVADCVEVPLIVQDASGYVGQAIPIAVHTTLLGEYGPEKILFKPEASPIGPNLSSLRDATAGRARIFEGSGGILLVDSYRRGIAGTMPGMDMLDGIVALWRALELGSISADSNQFDDVIYQLYFPICAIVALQLQAGLDGFLAIEKYLLVKRGIFKNAIRREPNRWQLDHETAMEVDRLYDHLQVAIHTSRGMLSQNSGT